MDQFTGSGHALRGTSSSCVGLWGRASLPNWRVRRPSKAPAARPTGACQRGGGHRAPASPTPPSGGASPWGMPGASARGQQRSVSVANGPLAQAAHLGQRPLAAMAQATCGLWHARGQGFKSPQLHQAQRLPRLPRRVACPRFARVPPPASDGALSALTVSGDPRAAALGRLADRPYAWTSHANDKDHRVHA
jgi:hypothetical protein